MNRRGFLSRILATLVLLGWTKPATLQRQPGASFFRRTTSANGERIVQRITWTCSPDGVLTVAEHRLLEGTVS